MRTGIYVSTALVLVVTLAAQTGCRRRVSQDEGPIIVQNGSMVIVTASDAEWQDDSGGAWTNETGKDHRGELWVRVDLTDGTPCMGSGHPVQVDYSVGGFKAMFNVVGNPARTKVSPKGQLEKETNQRLRHGTAGDGGYVTGVKINGQDLTCNITRDNLVSINICSSQDDTKCR